MGDIWASKVTVDKGHLFDELLETQMRNPGVIPTKSERGPGRRMSIPLVVDSRFDPPHRYVLYAESWLPTVPKETGWDEEDLRTETGVEIMMVEGDKVFGRVEPLKRFLRRLKSPLSRLKVERWLEALVGMSQIDEDSIEEMNSSWNRSDKINRSQVAAGKALN